MPALKISCHTFRNLRDNCCLEEIKIEELTQRLHLGDKIVAILNNNENSKIIIYSKEEEYVAGIITSLEFPSGRQSHILIGLAEKEKDRTNLEIGVSNFDYQKIFRLKFKGYPTPYVHSDKILFSLYPKNTKKQHF